MKTLQVNTISIRNFYGKLKRYYPAGVVNRILEEHSGMLWGIDAKVLFTTAKVTKPKIILEIGTYRGETTLGLANNAPQAKVYTIDIFRERRKDVDTYLRPEVLPKTRVGEVFKNKKKNIIQVFGDSRDIATYPFRGKIIDLAFIDGNHSIEAVVQDTQNVLKFMKHRAVIFWHDFNRDGYSQVPAALGYLKDKERLNIFNIKNTWLAACILHR